MLLAHLFLRLRSMASWFVPGHKPFLFSMLPPSHSQTTRWSYSSFISFVNRPCAVEIPKRSSYTPNTKQIRAIGLLANSFILSRQPILINKLLFMIFINFFLHFRKLEPGAHHQSSNDQRLNIQDRQRGLKDRGIINRN